MTATHLMTAFRFAAIETLELNDSLLPLSFSHSGHQFLTLWVNVLTTVRASKGRRQLFTHFFSFVMSAECFTSFSAPIPWHYSHAEQM